MKAFSSYRQRTRAQYGHRAHDPYRSRRTTAASWIGITLLLLVNIRIAAFDWPLPQLLLAYLAVSAVYVLLWYAWTGLEQRIFPSPSSEDTQTHPEVRSPVTKPPTPAMYSTRIRIAVPAYSAISIGLALTLTWLNQSIWLVALVWTAVGASYLYIGAALRRALYQTQGDTRHIPDDDD